MLHFDSDYMEGAHPAILERLAATNFDQTSGYGTDEVCAAARERIREACACPHANVYFLVGGTQANAAVADQILRPWDGHRVGDHRPHHRARSRRRGGVRAQDAAAAARRRQAGGRRRARAVRGVLGRREPRAHRGTGRRVHLAPHRVRHRVLAGRAGGRWRRCAATST